MPPFGLTQSGFIAPRATDLLDQIRSDYEDDTGLPIDWDADLFLGVITAVMSDRAGDLSEMLQAIADSRDPDNAAGHQLDAIASLVGVERIEASFSRVDLTLSGTPTTEIPAGSEVEYADGVIWATQDNVILDGNGGATVEAQPTETGPIGAAASVTDWEIVTPVDGWDSVESLEDATPGRDRETDAELRLRRSQSLQIIGSASLQAIRSNVLTVDGVQAAIAVDNDSNQDQTVAGLLLPAKSFALVVYPQLAAAQETELVESIYARAPAGIRSEGTESEVVTGADGFDKTIRWSYAVEVPVDVLITVEGVDPVIVENEIEAAIEDYFASLVVGDPVRILAILGILSEIEGIDSATVTLNGVVADIIPQITEIAILNTLTVN